MKRFVQVLSFDIAAKVALGLVAIALIRYMSTEQYAAFTLATSIATLAAQTLAAGFNRIYIVGFERLRLASRTEPFLGLQLVLIAAAALAALPAASALEGLYGAAVALAVAIVLSEFSKTYFQQALRFGRYSAIEVGRAATQALAIVGLIAAFGQAVRASDVLWIQAAALGAAFLVALGPTLSWGRIAVPRDMAAIAREIAGGPYAYLFAYFAVVAVFSQVDVIMLKLVGDAQMLAAYGSALRYYALLSLALGAVHAVLLPAIQRADTAAALEELYARHFRLLAVFIPAVALGAVAAGWVLPWIDLGRYPEAVPAFRILAASAIISFAFSPHVNLLLKLERFRFLFALIVAALIVDVLLNLALIPRFGAIGAAIATLLSSACVTFPIFIEARRVRPAQT